MTNMAKLSVGRLRPHFLSVCNVTYTSLNCTPGTYISEVNCRNTPKMVEEARSVESKGLYNGRERTEMMKYSQLTC